MPAFLVGVDQGTHDVVHAVVAEIEGEGPFERLVREAVTQAGYPLKGLVMDAAAPFLAAHANYFARAPLQLCRIHASRRLDFIISKAKRSPDAPLRAELKDRVRAVLFAPTEEEARRLFRDLLWDRSRYEGLGRSDTIGAMERSFDLYMTHHRVEGMPADANITENVIKQLGKKLRLMEGFRLAGVGRAILPTPDRLLPLQTVHGLEPEGTQQTGSPRARWRRSQGPGLAVVPSSAVGIEPSVRPTRWDARQLFVNALGPLKVGANRPLPARTRGHR